MMAGMRDRAPGELRPVDITRHYTTATPGSVLIKVGGTWVLCTASVSADVPRWMKDTGKGWVTAERNDVQLRVVAPEQVAAGQPIELRIAVNDPMGLVDAMAVAWRDRGAEFRERKLTVADDGKLTILLSDQADQPLHYLIRALDEAGRELVAIGSEGSPKCIGVRRAGWRALFRALGGILRRTSD